MNDNLKKNHDSDKNKKNKRAIIITALAMIACLGLLYLTTFILEKCTSDADQPPVNNPDDYEFYTPDFMANIFLDEDYLKLDRTIRYTDASMGVTVSLNEKNVSKQPESAQFMYNLVNAIIRGDEDTYNSMFSDAYYTKESIKTDFTMQRLYNISIKKESETTVADGGVPYKKYVCSLEYFIQKNDGTYRDDMGSDCSKRQKFTITNRDGELLIDLVSTVYYK